MYALYVVGAILLAGSLANIHSWARAFSSLFFSQGRHLKRTFKMNEGAPLTALGAEVSIMTDMVKVSIPRYLFYELYFTEFSSAWTLSRNSKAVWLALSTHWTVATQNAF